MAEIEPLQRPDRGKLLQAEGADFRVLQAEVFQLRQPRQHDEFLVGDRRAVERHRGDLPLRHLHLAADGAQPFGDRRIAPGGHHRRRDGALRFWIGGLEDEEVGLRQLRGDLANARGGHAAVTQVDGAEICQARQLRQSGVRHFRAVQAELFELGHVLQDVDAGVGHVRALQIEAAQLRQLRQMRQAGIGHRHIRQVELDEVRQPGEILDAGIGDRRPTQIQPLQRGLALQARHAGVVEGHRVIQIEMGERKRRERHARAARLVDAHLLEVLQRRKALQRGIVERDIGLHGLTHHELFERRRFVEQGNRRLDTRCRLVVPEPAVDVQLLQVRQRREATELVLQRRGVHRNAGEIERMNAELRRSVGRRDRLSACAAPRARCCRPCAASTPPRCGRPTAQARRPRQISRAGCWAKATGANRHTARVAVATRRLNA